MHVASLAWLHCTIGEPQPIQYLKSVFLEILNVTTWSVFQNQVTYIYDIDINFMMILLIIAMHENYFNMQNIFQSCLKIISWYPKQFQICIRIVNLKQISKYF